MRYACVVMLLLVLIGCGRGEGTDAVQAAKTEKLMAEAEAQIGMPGIVNFQERKLAKMIFELRDKEDLVCYAYLQSRWTGKLVYVGRCLGFGLPYSVQYTNPQRFARRSGSMSEWDVLPQADPNGLFMPTGLAATWLMMVDPETGDARPVYFEPEIVVSPFPLHAEVTE